MTQVFSNACHDVRLNPPLELSVYFLKSSLHYMELHESPRIFKYQLQESPYYLGGVWRATKTVVNLKVFGLVKHNFGRPP